MSRIVINGIEQIIQAIITSDVTFAAGKHLVLPQHNDAVTPTLAFEDGNTGFYESADNIIKVAIAGSLAYSISATTIASAINYSFRMQQGPGTAVDPIYAFLADENTGIGRAAADQLSLIAGGFEGLRFTEENNVVNMNIVCHEGAVVTHNDNVVTLN